jgi:hypothetical protein
VTDATVDQRTASRSDEWRERIAEQERSGTSVKRFRKGRGLTECSFYAWRKRLRQRQEPVRFALVERRARRRQEDTWQGSLELVMPTGARLRISPGVDRTTLRTVLGALRV